MKTLTKIGILVAALLILLPGLSLALPTGSTVDKPAELVGDFVGYEFYNIDDDTGEKLELTAVVWARMVDPGYTTPIENEAGEMVDVPMARFEYYLQNVWTAGVQPVGLPISELTIYDIDQPFSAGFDNDSDAGFWEIDEVETDVDQATFYFAPPFGVASGNNTDNIQLSKLFYIDNPYPAAVPEDFNSWLIDGSVSSDGKLLIGMKSSTDDNVIIDPTPEPGTLLLLGSGLLGIGLARRRRA